MTLAETIYQRSLSLPDAAAREALDFIEFLGQRYGADGRNATVSQAWFQAQVQRAVDDPRASISHEEVSRHFAARRETLRASTDK